MITNNYDNTNTSNDNASSGQGRYVQGKSCIAEGLQSCAKKKSQACASLLSIFY